MSKKLPVTPGQLAAGVIAGSGGLYSLYRRLAPQLPQPSEPEPDFEAPPVAKSARFREALAIVLADERAAMRKAALLPNAVPKPPTSPVPYGAAPTPELALPDLEAGTMPPPAPKGLLARITDGYNKRVSPVIHDATQWANDKPFQAAAALGVDGLGAYGIYNALAPDDDEDEEGYGYKQADGVFPNLSPDEARGAVSRLLLLNALASAAPIAGATLGAANAPKNYFGQSAVRGLVRGAGAGLGMGLGALGGAYLANDTTSPELARVGVGGGAAAGGYGGYQLANAVLGADPWEGDDEDAGKPVAKAAVAWPYALLAAPPAIAAAGGALNAEPGGRLRGAGRGLVRGAATTAGAGLGGVAVALALMNAVERGESYGLPVSVGSIGAGGALGGRAGSGLANLVLGDDDEPAADEPERKDDPAKSN